MWKLALESFFYPRIPVSDFWFFQPAVTYIARFSDQKWSKIRFFGLTSRQYYSCNNTAIFYFCSIIIIVLWNARICYRNITAILPFHYSIIPELLHFYSGNLLCMYESECVGLCMTVWVYVCVSVCVFVGLSVCVFGCVRECF